MNSPNLSRFEGFVQDSGEGRCTIQTAIEEALPARVLSAALYTRFRSRQDRSFAERVLSAMRHQFGGHVELPTGGLTSRNSEFRHGGEFADASCGGCP